MAVIKEQFMREDVHNDVIRDFFVVNREILKKTASHEWNICRVLVLDFTPTPSPFIISELFQALHSKITTATC